MTEPADQRPRDGSILTLFWIVGTGLFLYVGLFVVLVLDGPVFQTNIIENGIRNLSPELHTAVGEVLQVVYFPLLWPLRMAGLIP